MLTTEQIDDYTDQAKTELGAVKSKLDKEKDAKQEEMFKRLSQNKRKTLADQVCRLFLA